MRNAPSPVTRLSQVIPSQGNETSSIHGSRIWTAWPGGTFSRTTSRGPRVTVTSAVSRFGLVTTSRKSKSSPSSSRVFASGAGQYSQPTYERVCSAIAQASSQSPAAPHATSQSPQSRSTCQPDASSAHTIDTSPSQRCDPGTQVTHPSRGSQASGQTVSSVRVSRSAPQT